MRVIHGAAAAFLAMLLSCGPGMMGYNSGGGPPAAAGELAAGDRVSCNWKGGGTFYDGTVAELRPGGRVFIHYDDGDVEETSPSMCTVLSKSGGNTIASGGDGPIATGSRVSCNWKNGGTYYDGTVAEQRAGGRIFVHYDDGDVEETSPSMCRLLAGGAAPTDTSVTTGGGLSGGYTIVSSQNPGGGAAYTGTVRIAKIGDAYRLDWSIPNSPPYSGVGIEMNGILAVGWSVGGSPGVVVYRVSGGQLAGRWSSLGNRGPIGTEDLSGPPGVSGSFQITRGLNPQGGSYTGSVQITPTGSTHALSWTLPRESYTGVGILKRDVLAVGWGPGTGVVAYEIHGARLDGVWADPRGGNLGTEVLERR